MKKRASERLEEIAAKLATDHPEVMKQICNPSSKIPIGSLSTITDVLPKGLLAKQPSRVLGSR